MQFINYFLVLIVSFLGIFIGSFLAINTKEELKQGKKYFILLQKILLTLIFGFLLSFYELQLNAVLFISLVFLVFLLFIEPNQPSVHIALAIILVLTSCSTGVFLVEASLIFLYGLPTGTLLTQSMIKEKKSRIIWNLFKNFIWFVVIAISLYYLNSVTTFLC